MHGINDLGVQVEAQFGKTWRFVDFQRFELVAPAPSGMPTVAPSMPEPEPTCDCSVRPPGGIAAIDWSLHCEGIDEPFSPYSRRGIGRLGSGPQRLPIERVGGPSAPPRS